LDAGLFEPAFGFGGFEFEFGDGFDRVTGGDYLGVVAEFEGSVDGAGEGAVEFASKREEIAVRAVVRR
jgi:hypothetical protein